MNPRGRHFSALFGYGGAERQVVHHRPAPRFLMFAGFLKQEALALGWKVGKTWVLKGPKRAFQVEKTAVSRGMEAGRSSFWEYWTQRAGPASWSQGWHGLGDGGGGVSRGRTPVGREIEADSHCSPSPQAVAGSPQGCRLGAAGAPPRQDVPTRGRPLERLRGGPRGGRQRSGPSAAGSLLVVWQTQVELWLPRSCEVSGWERPGRPSPGGWGTRLGLRLCGVAARGEGRGWRGEVWMCVATGSSELRTPGEFSCVCKGGAVFPLLVRGALLPTYRGWGALPFQRWGPFPLSTYTSLCPELLGAPLSP